METKQLNIGDKVSIDNSQNIIGELVYCDKVKPFCIVKIGGAELQFDLSRIEKHNISPENKSIEIIESDRTTHMYANGSLVKSSENEELIQTLLKERKHFESENKHIVVIGSGSNLEAVKEMAAKIAVEKTEKLPTIIVVDDPKIKETTFPIKPNPELLFTKYDNLHDYSDFKSGKDLRKERRRNERKNKR